MKKPKNLKRAPAVAVQRVVRPGPRTFQHFPETAKCPICGTNDDGETVLVQIAGTAKDYIAEAKPMHLACAVATQWDSCLGIALTFGAQKMISRPVTEAEILRWEDALEDAFWLRFPCGSWEDPITGTFYSTKIAHEILQKRSANDRR